MAWPIHHARAAETHGGWLRKLNNMLPRRTLSFQNAPRTGTQRVLGHRVTFPLNKAVPPLPLSLINKAAGA